VQPAFTAAAANATVSGALFAEVECRANQALCGEHGAGAGGWPTVKAFSAAHPEGAPFPRKLPGLVCEELRTAGRLPDYIAETVAGSAGATKDL
jgi:hypothetical protein